MAFQWYPNGKYKDLFALATLKITVIFLNVQISQFGTMMPIKIARIAIHRLLFLLIVRLIGG